MVILDKGDILSVSPSSDSPYLLLYSRIVVLLVNIRLYSIQTAGL